MVHSLCKELNITNSEVFFWTDSTIVLSWLQKPSCQWPTFVANRVSFILEKAGTDNWNHVESHHNPADLASRGISAKDLSTSDIWWRGPEWLNRPQSEWPRSHFIPATQLETRVVQVNATHIDISEDFLLRFSDLPRALRVLSYVFRFYHSVHPKKKQSRKNLSDQLSQAEVRFATNRLVILCQSAHFPEYSTLESGSTLSHKSSLLVFNPFIDSQGFLRINGRLSSSPTLTYNERFPKLLPYHGRFTRLYLEYLHKFSAHAEISLMLRLFRQEFWVPKLKNLIRTVVHNCKVCSVYKRKLGQQIMAALPPERTTLTRPFTHTGLDFAGPFEIKSYIGRGCRITKGYVLVFVCFCTRAIHLEATNDMSTDCFLAAFARFFSRRGCPAHIYSDNGTAFVGAANILNKNRAQFLVDLKRQLVAQNAFQLIDWHFIPNGAPHMGGLWEAGVKGFKTNLRKI